MCFWCRWARQIKDRSTIIPVPQAGSWGTLVSQGLCCGFPVPSRRIAVVSRVLQPSLCFSHKPILPCRRMHRVSCCLNRNLDLHVPCSSCKKKAPWPFWFLSSSRCVSHHLKYTQWLKWVWSCSSTIFQGGYLVWLAWGHEMPEGPVQSTAKLCARTSGWGHVPYTRDS